MVKSSFLSKCRSSLVFGVCTLGVFSSIGVTTFPALAEDTNARIERLQRDVDTLNQAVYKGQKPPTPLVSSPSADYQSTVETRISQIETQLRDLTGKVEQQGYDIAQLKQRLDRSLSDMDLRLNSVGRQGASPLASQQQETTNPGEAIQNSDQITNQMGTLKEGDMGGAVENNGSDITSNNQSQFSVDNHAEPDQSMAPKNLGILTQTSDGLTAVVPQSNGRTGRLTGDAAADYESAYSLYKSGNYVASRAGFDQFMKSYPAHPLAPNALYWSGENYYAEKSYDKAIRIFAESYKKYPKGPKAAESLLKLGMSLNKAGKPAQACITYDQLKQEYTTGNNNVLRMADQEIAALKCSQ